MLTQIVTSGDVSERQDSRAGYSQQLKNAQERKKEASVLRGQSHLLQAKLYFKNCSNFYGFLKQIIKCVLYFFHACLNGKHALLYQ